MLSLSCCCFDLLCLVWFGLIDCCFAAVIVYSSWLLGVLWCLCCLIVCYLLLVLLYCVCGCVCTGGFTCCLLVCYLFVLCFVAGVSFYVVVFVLCGLLLLIVCIYVS